MIISFNDLPSIRKNHPGKTIVFTSGSFDMTHAGHVLFFEDAKRNGDILVVMVGNDAAIKRNKGPQRPILNEHLRMKMIDALKPVDYTVLDIFSDKTEHPLGGIEEAFDTLHPDNYVVNDDGFEIPYRHEMAKRHDVNMIVLPRTAPAEFEKISTSGIIKKIKELD